MSGSIPAEAVADMEAAAETGVPESEAEQPVGAASGSESAGDPTSLAQVMLLLTKLIQSMPANIAAAVKVDKPFSHLDNAKLDNRNFARIKTFTNKHSEWRGWKNQFQYAVAECDSSFAADLTGMEKRDKPIESLADLNPTQIQLSAVLFNRLQAVTTGTANTMVLSS